MALLAFNVLDVAIFASMGSLWVFGAAFIYFVWRWAIRTEAERAQAWMRPQEPPAPPTPPVDQRVTLRPVEPVVRDPGAGMGAVSLSI